MQERTIVFDTLNIKSVRNDQNKTIVFGNVETVPTEFLNDQYSLIQFEL